MRLSVHSHLGSKGFERAAVLLSFIVPSLIRWVPEAQFPYPIGFDTPLYVSWGKNYGSNPLAFPLMLPLLGGLCALGFDMVAVMKYLPTLLYGLLGLSIYSFSRFYLRWRLQKSLLVVFLVAFSFPSLRVSWDMHKQLMATAFLLLALSFLRVVDKPEGFVPFAVFNFLAAFSHQVLFGVLMAVLSYVFLVELRQERKKALLVLAVALSTFLIFVGVWYGWSLGMILRMGAGEIVPNSSSLFDRWTWEVNKNLFEFFQLYGLLVPFVVLGLFRNDVLLPWLCLGLLGSFSPVLFPFHIPSIMPSRWMLLLAYPFSFYVVKALERLDLLRVNSLERLVALISVVFLVNLPSWGFLGFFPQPSLYFRDYLLPKSMASSSIPTYDIEATIWLAERFEEFGGQALIVHGHYLGWARYCTEKVVVTFGELYGGGRSIAEALEMAQNSSYGDIYLLWYVDGDAYSSGFAKVVQRGPMKLYRYIGDGAE